MARSAGGSFQGTAYNTLSSGAVIDIATGTNRKLIVIPHSEENTTTENSPSCTYDGNAMTQVTGSDLQIGSTFNNRLTAFYYDVPDGDAATGHTIAVTMSTGSCDSVIANWAVFTGRATGQPNTVATYSSTSDTSNALTVAVAASGSDVISAGGHGNSGTWTHDASQSENSDATINSSSTSTSYIDNVSSDTAMTDTASGAAARFVQIGFAMAAVAAGGANPKGPLGNPFFGPFGGPI